MDVVLGCAYTYTSFQGWEVATGWTLDKDQTFSSYYFYCRRTNEGRGPFRGGPLRDEEREWQWRIAYVDERYNTLIFNSLEEFLDWLASWYDREVHGDRQIAAAHLENPPWIEGVHDVDEDEEEEEDEGELWYR